MATKNSNVKKGNATSVEMNPDQVREFVKCAKDPIYFITKYVYVRHPVTGRTLFNLYEYQRALIDAYHNNKDVITLLPRQSGKCCTSTTLLTTLQTKHSVPVDRTIESLWNECIQYPINITDESTNELKFTGQAAPTELLILTPTGFQPVKHIHKTVPYHVWKLHVVDCDTLLCADTHVVISADGREVFVKDLVPGDMVTTKRGPRMVTACENTLAPAEPMFDIELNDDNHVYYTNDILSHNSETSCAYLFWFSIFNKDKTVLITSNKHKNSSEMISRIKYMYEGLPDFLKPGVTDDGWNKLSLKFETGSRIISDATSETTGRGGSFSILYCLSGETLVQLKSKESGEIYRLSIEKLMQKISNDGVSEFKPNTTFLINTPTGWQDFRGVMYTGLKHVIRLTMHSGGELVCTPEHPIFTNNTCKMAGDFHVGDTVDHANGQDVVSAIDSINEPHRTYDIIGSEDHLHRFFAGEFYIVKNCDETAFVRPNIQAEFWASISPTLATGGKLFMTSTPNGDSDLFATLWRGAIAGTNGMKPLTIKWNDVPGRDENFKKKEIAKNGELKWRQEFECFQDSETITLQDDNGEVRTITLGEAYRLLMNDVMGTTADVS